MGSATMGSSQRVMFRAIAGFVCIAIGTGACATDVPSPSMDAQTTEASAQPDDDLIRDFLGLIPGREAPYLERLAACLRSQGWDAEVIEDGEAIRFDYGSAANRGAYDASKRACDVAVPPPPVEPLTDDGILAVHAHWIDMRGCLVGLGYAISEPPPVETFLRAWKANGDIWSPYLDLSIRGPEATEDVCPQQPPGDG